MSTLQIVRRRIEEVLPYAANSKTHPASQVEAIAASIRRFGFNDPIAITASGVIIEGHGRLMAAQSLGMDEVPVLMLPDLTEDQADLYRIAHNKIALSSTFDFGMLVSEIRDIASAGAAQFGDMGFTQQAVDTLFQMFEGENAPTAGQATAAAGGPEHGLAPGNNTSAGLDAEIVWDDRAQRDRWNAFSQTVCGAAADQTRGEALTTFFAECMSGDRVPGQSAETSTMTDEAAMDWMTP